MSMLSNLHILEQVAKEIANAQQREYISKAKQEI